MIGIREWRRPREFSKGALKMVSSGTMYALSSLFIDNSTHIHCGARVVDLQIPDPTHYHHFLLPPPLFATKLSRCRSSGFNKIKPLIGYPAAVCLKELNAEKEAWEAPAITVAREEPAQQIETAALSTQVNLPRRLRLPVIYPSL